MSNAPPPTTYPHPDDYAVLIGVSRYDNLRALKGPPNDVQGMYDWLTATDGGGLDPSNIVIVLSKEDEPKDKPVSHATLEHVQNALRELVERAHWG
ncbi:MAG TPA: caspase family protein, partial [Pyrinomonadaceae bacterium]|nr:caspase family protein [Pyrinomonadaceae bacterium]